MVSRYIKFKVISNLTEEIHSITAGIRSRELCQAPISASAFIPLAGVVGKSLSFSALQMQRRLRPDSNARLEATYCHSHLSSRLNERRHRSRHIYQIYKVLQNISWNYKLMGEDQMQLQKGFGPFILWYIPDPTQE